ncbi:MAG: hypothetical protein GXP08_03750 [Gammaproteobacteria bacterium]|nr:hypothetical protein [Gammaproteobacteria bacterium]
MRHRHNGESRWSQQSPPLRNRIDCCTQPGVPSYGREGFERHVALSIVATNLHRIGLLLQRKELARLRRDERRRQQPPRLAA